MKAAVLHQYDENLSSNEFVQYEDVPDPKIQRPTDVIVRIGGAGVAAPTCMWWKASGAIKSM